MTLFFFFFSFPFLASCLFWARKKGFYLFFSFLASMSKQYVTLSTLSEQMFFHFDINCKEYVKFKAFNILLALFFAPKTSAPPAPPQPLSHLRCNLGSLATSKVFLCTLFCSSSIPSTSLLGPTGADILTSTSSFLTPPPTTNSFSLALKFFNFVWHPLTASKMW